MITHTACSEKGQDRKMTIEWNNDMKLPPNNQMVNNVGLAGAYAGIIDNELIVIGGANFPIGFPWTGGTKTWWSTMYSKNLSEDSNVTWSVNEDFLESPMGYGVSIQLRDEILLIGGCNQSKCYSSVYSVRKEKGAIVLVDNAYPPLPTPLANACGTMIDNKLYILGGQESMVAEESTKYFFTLDLKNKEAGWQTLPAWDGPSRGYAVCETQAGKLYLFSGRSYAPNEDTMMHTDGYCYDPNTNKWKTLVGEFPIMAGTAVSHSNDKIIFLGGVHEILPTVPEHPGFSNDVRVFDVNTQSLSTLTTSPYPIAVTTKTVVNKDTLYIASGEIKPGIRTPHILKGIIK